MFPRVIEDQGFATRGLSSEFHAQSTLSGQLAEAWSLSCTGRPELARLMAEEARQGALAGGDLEAFALANEYLAWFCLIQSRFEEGLRHASAAASLWRDLSDRAHEAISRGTLAWLMCEAGEEEAIAEAQRAVALAEQTDDLSARIWVQNALCVVLWMLQQHDLARHAGMEAVALARRSADPPSIGRCLLNAALPEEGLAELAAQSGNRGAERLHRGRAIDLTREAAATCTSCGDSWAAYIALCNLVEWLIRADRAAEAGRTLEEARSLPGEVTASRRVALLHMNALLVAYNGDAAESVLLFQDALETALAANDLCVGVQLAKELSAALEACGRFEEALHRHREFFSLYIRRSAERSQLRARVLSGQQDFRELQARVARFERLAGEDALTGLANRRHLDLLMLEHCRHPDAFGVAMIDVDHFKAVNDKLTHLVGDKVLRKIGNILEENKPAHASLGRFGGEEFLLIVPPLIADDGYTVCENIRSSIRDADWQNIDQRLNVTVSIGYAIHNPGDDPSVVMDLADRRLYAAKERGRNCVIVL